MYSSNPMYCTCTSGQDWKPSNCPDCRGVLNSRVVLYRITTIGTKASVHIREVSLFQRFHCIHVQYAVFKNTNSICTVVMYMYMLSG